MSEAGASRPTDGPEEARPATADLRTAARRSFLVWGRCLAPLTAVVVVWWTVNLGAAWALGSPDPLGLSPDGAPDAALAAAWSGSARYRVLELVAGSLAFLRNGALTAIAGLHLLGRPVTVRAAGALLVRSAPALAGLGVLAQLPFVVPRLAAPLLTAIDPWWVPAIVELPPLLILPVYVAWSLVTPAVVLEGRGLRSALGRSGALTAGRRWRLVLLYVQVGLPAAAWELGASALLPAAPTVPALRMLVQGLLDAPFLVAMPVAWHLLRVAREGASTAALARVFE